MPVDPPKEEAPRKPWVPPVVLAALAFSVGLGAGVFNLAEKVWSYVGPPRLPVVTEEYLMVSLVEGALDGESLRAQLATLATQVKGLKVVTPTWLSGIEGEVDRMVMLFCEQAPEAQRLSCRAEARTRVLLGGYALKSFDSRPIGDIGLTLARLESGLGWVDAYDGFVDGALSPDKRCLVSGLSGACMADWQGDETLTDLPTLGPGEMMLVPIFLSVQMSWGAPDGNWFSDGYAPAPLRFPARVTWEGRDLIAHPREMRETPSLQQGFYEGRG